MPDGLLLLAFALTLVVNAVLIVVAIRAMRPGGALDEEPVVAPRVRDDRPAPAGDPSRTTVIPLTSSAEAAGVDDAVARPLADAVITELPVEAQATAADLPTSVDSATARDSAAAPEPEAAPRRRPRARSSVAASATTPRPTKTAGNGRRRRFSLPPLDDDHEKVNRS